MVILSDSRETARVAVSYIYGTKDIPEQSSKWPIIRPTFVTIWHWVEK
jgi:hypothetical protein